MPIWGRPRNLHFFTVGERTSTAGHFLSFIATLILRQMPEGVGRILLKLAWLPSSTRAHTAVMLTITTLSSWACYFRRHTGITHSTRRVAAYDVPPLPQHILATTIADRAVVCVQKRISGRGNKEGHFLPRTPLAYITKQRGAAVIYGHKQQRRPSSRGGGGGYKRTESAPPQHK